MQVKCCNYSDSGADGSDDGDCEGKEVTAKSADRVLVEFVTPQTRMLSGQLTVHLLRRSTVHLLCRSTVHLMAPNFSTSRSLDGPAKTAVVAAVESENSQAETRQAREIHHPLLRCIIRATHHPSSHLTTHRLCNPTVTLRSAVPHVYTIVWGSVRARQVRE